MNGGLGREERERHKEYHNPLSLVTHCTSNPVPAITSKGTEHSWTLMLEASSTRVNFSGRTERKFILQLFSI
ncbi:hypothetical protein Pmani_016777 [Petrolisthes manimaculis]|uniref:Uncharacterized protein n=1 Tax=Petrolisthes manimaculis TaxID=1843537 RepID=A0AAE1PNJ1_9EUCA|nr:hypothetical protein Pmani_016777 [Petrolisthes manimaculis]